MSKKNKPSVYSEIVDGMNDVTEEEQTIIQNGKPETVIQAKMNLDESKPKKKQKKDVDDLTSIRIEIDTTKPESKSKRLQLLMRPSLYAKVKAEADKMGISVNDLISQVMDAYVKGVNR